MNDDMVTGHQFFEVEEENCSTIYTVMSSLDNKNKCIRFKACDFVVQQLIEFFFKLCRCFDVGDNFNKSTMKACAKFYSKRFIFITYSLQ